MTLRLTHTTAHPVTEKKLHGYSRVSGRTERRFIGQTTPNRALPTFLVISRIRSLPMRTIHAISITVVSSLVALALICGFYFAPQLRFYFDFHHLNRPGWWLATPRPIEDMSASTVPERDCPTSATNLRCHGLESRKKRTTDGSSESSSTPAKTLPLLTLKLSRMARFLESATRAYVTLYR